MHVPRSRATSLQPACNQPLVRPPLMLGIVDQLDRSTYKYSIFLLKFNILKTGINYM